MSQFKSIEEKFCTVMNQNVVWEVYRDTNGNKKHKCLSHHKCSGSGEGCKNQKLSNMLR